MEIRMRAFRLIPQLLVFMLAYSMVNVQAEDFRGRIVKVQGTVYVVNDKGQRRSPEKSQFLVNNNETVVTGKGGKAVVQFDDGALSVLNEKSKVKVEKSGWLSHLSGKIYYLFRKVSSKEKSRKVKTGFTTIGIRGTTFIVYDEGDEKSVALEEGKLNIESPDKPYEIHKPKPEDDFESFKKQMQKKKDALDREYSDYKDKISKDFVEYKKSFDLEANRIISFSGNRVDETELSDSSKEEFGDFSDYAKDYINSYKELEEETIQ
jgi:hypothetical protein